MTEEYEVMEVHPCGKQRFRNVNGEKEVFNGLPRAALRLLRKTLESPLSKVVQTLGELPHKLPIDLLQTFEPCVLGYRNRYVLHGFEKEQRGI